MVMELIKTIIYHYLDTRFQDDPSRNKIVNTIYFICSKYNTELCTTLLSVIYGLLILDILSAAEWEVLLKKFRNIAK
jgi:hypothetical protein